MPFSHHSHSGQFCGHAVDTLEECIQQAIRKGLTVFALTEHMPRDKIEDLYPEEVELNLTNQHLFDLFDRYYHAALSLREKYAREITLLIGFEIDYIRPDSIRHIQQLQSKYPHDLFVGSVHHVATKPIDYDNTLYTEAINALPANDAAVQNEEALFEQYFEDQYAMLTALKPKIVGHFDLIRLKSSNHKRDLREWKNVWGKVQRNVKFIASYGGLVELNSAALRKGWETPYPGKDVFELMKANGIKFTLSDDSHGIDQVAYGYDKVIKYLEDYGVEEVYYYTWRDCTRRPGDDGINQIFDNEGKIRENLPDVGDVVLKSISVGELRGMNGATLTADSRIQ